MMAAVDLFGTESAHAVTNCTSLASRWSRVGRTSFAAAFVAAHDVPYKNSYSDHQAFSAQPTSLRTSRSRIPRIVTKCQAPTIWGDEGSLWRYESSNEAASETHLETQRKQDPKMQMRKLKELILRDGESSPTHSQNRERIHTGPQPGMTLSSPLSWLMLVGVPWREVCRMQPLQILAKEAGILLDIYTTENPIPMWTNHH